MYQVEGKKASYKYNCTPLYCYACLSSDRALSSINKYLDIFQKICDIPYTLTPTKIVLCWECMAILKKAKLLKSKVDEAQRMLTHDLNNEKNPFPNSLSTLTKAYNNNELIISYDEESKPALEIKQKINQSEDNLDRFDQSPDYFLSTIKKEKVKNIQKRNKIKNKQCHYAFVYDSGVRKKSLLRKKFDIKEHEVGLWMEKEKCSEFYIKFKFKCKNCLQGWNCKDKLDGHYLKYHDETIGPYKCEICNTRFKDVTSKSTHVTSHYSGYECVCCNYRCYTARRLNAHLDTHRKVQCIYCGACFSDLQQFYKHYKSLHSVFICDHCGKRCRSKHMLEKHMGHHAEVHKCKSCQKRYKSRSALRKHYAAKHRATLAEHAYCVLCDKQYENAFVYRRHVQNSAAHAHERERAPTKKAISCPECGNTYSRRIYMMNHYRHVHMNQSQYHCNHCDRHFLNRTRYVDHMKYNHEGVKKEKNKLCNICGRGFATNRILMNHIRTHSGERPYECELCGAKFTQKHSMLSHIKYIHLKSTRRTHWHQ